MSSLRYVRIWNETYTSFRTFENYSYFDKGIGYPRNSYESIKYNHTFLNYLPTFIGLSIEIWRKGNRNLISAFHDKVNLFPVTPVLQGITFNMNASTLWEKIKYVAYMEMIYKPESWNKSVLVIDIDENIDFKEIIEDYFKNGSEWEWNINYSQGPVEWETARRLWEARDLLHERFMLLYSDNFVPFSYVTGN